MELELNSKIVIDGLLWQVERFQGENVARAVHMDSNRAIWFDKREVKHMGGELFGLPGRIEAPVLKAEASVVAGVAKADISTN